MPPHPVYDAFVGEIFTGTFLIALACYCLGLQIGWSSNQVIPTLGSIILTIVVIQLVIIKGLGVDVIVMSILFIAASLVRTWQKFVCTSL